MCELVYVCSCSDRANIDKAGVYVMCIATYIHVKCRFKYLEQIITVCTCCSNAANVKLWYKIMLAVAVVITIISLILWLALIGYTASNGEYIICIHSIGVFEYTIQL